MAKQLSAKEQRVLMDKLKERFDKHMHRHPDIDWTVIEEKLLNDKKKLSSIALMEVSGGEPDLVLLDGDPAHLYYVDCSPESPTERRNLSFDEAARTGRKKNAPESSVEAMANTLGIKLLNEEQYRALQAIEPFDLKTSTWIDTPKAIRDKGGALFCDCRYGHVFTYHNGADSYYASRGFRGYLEL